MILFYNLLPSKESHLHVIPSENISDALHLHNIAVNFQCVIRIHNASLFLQACNIIRSDAKIINTVKLTNSDYMQGKRTVAWIRQ
jgi:hypothetical protein